MFEEYFVIPPGTLVIILIVGLLFAFCGRALWKTIWFFIGGMFGLAAGLAIGYIVGMFIFDAVICAIVAGIVGFIIGGYMGISSAKWMIALSGAFTGYWVGSTFGDCLVGLILAIVFFLVIYIWFDQVLSIATAIMGGLMVGAVAYTFAGGAEGNPWSTVALFVVGIPIIILGARTQLEIEKRYPQTKSGEMQ